MIRKLLYSTAVIIAFSGVTASQDFEISYSDKAYVSLNLSAGDFTPPRPIRLLDITDSLSDEVVGREAVHQVGFQLPHFEYQPAGLLRGRQVVITFPPEFDVSTIQHVSYWDTDESHDPKIEAVFVYSHTVVIRFKDDVPGPIEPHYAYIKLYTIDNPTLAGDFRVVVSVDNKLGQTIAGPDHSAPFSIIPGEAVSLVISPVDDMTLRAGEGIVFEAATADQYGNPIDIALVEWSLDPDRDPIGQLFGPFFLATTAGQGRVIARIDAMEAYSGLITVVSGEFAALGIELDETQFIGNGFRGQAQVAALDAYGNRIEDFNTSGIDLHLGSETGAIYPDILPAGAFDAGVADLNDFVYWGDPGPADLTITGDGVHGSADFEANGVFAILREDLRIPDWVPHMWEFFLGGYTVNPAGLLPVKVRYKTEFAGAETPEPFISRPVDCVPLPNHGQECPFNIRQLAGVDPGVYEFAFTVEAVYVYNDDSLIAPWTIHQTIEVVPFQTFSLQEPLALPPTLISADYLTYTSVTLLNENVYDKPAKASVDLVITREEEKYHIGGGTFPFDWADQTEVTIQIAMNSAIPLGGYDYSLSVSAGISGRDLPYYLVYTTDIPLNYQVEIISRADLSLDTTSITPKVVPAGSPAVFQFDVILTGYTTIDINGVESSLLLTDGTVTTVARLAEDTYHLEAKPNTLATRDIFIPESWAARTISATLHLVGVEEELIAVDTTLVFVLPVTIAPAAGIQIVSVTNEARNSPFVNTGQAFTILASIRNHSPVDVGALEVGLVSDGQSVLPPSVIVPGISAMDTLAVGFDIIAADLPNPAEMFTLKIFELPGGIDVLPPIDNSAVAVVQTPARLELTAEVVDNPGPVAALAYTEEFDISASFSNRGQADISGGSVVLEYSGPGEFGIQFPAESPLDSTVTWPLTAPAFDIDSEFTVRWGEIPTDRNTGGPAVIVGESVALPFSVRAAETKLVVQAGAFQTQPLQRGISSRLFDLTLENVTNDSRNTIALRALVLELVDRDGSTIDAREVVADTGSNFYINGQPAGVMGFEYKLLAYDFPEVVIAAGQRVVMEYRLAPTADAEIDYFNMRLESDMIEAEIIAGPQAGERVVVTGVLDRAFEINLPQSIIPVEFAASFKNYPNPFNPEFEPTEFRYNLPTDSDVDIHIYTATGEKVRELHFDAGGHGGQAGLNAGIYWDGRNGEGDMVLNGVYVAYVEVAAEGLTATVKMAVLK